MEDGSERPVALASRTMNTAEKNYSQVEKEELAIVYGVTKFHQYVYGQKFDINGPQAATGAFRAEQTDPQHGRRPNSALGGDVGGIGVQPQVQGGQETQQCRRPQQTAAGDADIEFEPGEIILLMDPVETMTSQPARFVGGPTPTRCWHK
eukprot:TRINITY_DN28898_c1_g1_i1.p1 TRINITY_DN28898_c1_g1~~TRINITY_DN28898_c1_g1_i1.p1  ORF type:complete len:150 (-),score=26.66 TRINITY_DN28898_c1_g1_i1:39-488(-)